MDQREHLETLRQEFFRAATRYAWLENLGAGGMGVVFKALDRDLGEPVAIKVLRMKEGPENDDSLARFKREISLSRKVTHPSVARVHDLGMAGGHFFLTMEYVEGYTLAETLEAVGPLAATDAVGYLRQIALGVGAAHSIGIIHRDLKPHNVMVDRQGAIVILDFGLAFRPSMKSITSGDACIGTPRYMAPEQATAGPVDARTDVYAIGVIAFELLTGTVPFSASSPYETARLQVEAPVPGHMLTEAGVPAALAEIVLECLEKDPALRPASGNELEARLARLRLGADAVNGKETLPERPPRTRELPRDGEHPDLATQPVASVPLPGGNSPTETSPGPAAVGRAPVVLVADDDESFRAFARAVLEAEGMEVRTAVSGEDALHALHGSGVDLALLDLWMPAADGLDVLRIHRSQNPERPVPVVLVSASVSRAQIAFAIRHGALEVLAKPLTPEVLAACAGRHLAELGFVLPA